MEISETQEGNITVIKVKGRLDVLSSKDMNQSLREVIDKGHYQILLDCSELDFVSSSGLRVLIQTAKQLRKLNGKIGLCTIKDHIYEVLEIAGIFSLLPVSSNLKEALKKF